MTKISTMTINSKTFKNLLLHIQKAYDFETWCEDSGGEALQNLYKSYPWDDFDLFYSKVNICLFIGRNDFILIGRNYFSFQFRKIITRYRRVGYNLNVMRQSACLVFNPIMADNYAAFFNCTPVGRASDSMMAPT